MRKALLPAWQRRIPKVEMSFDVCIGSAIELIMFPFRIAVFGDFAPGSAIMMADPRDREFLCVDSRQVDQALAELKPQLEFEIRAISRESPSFTVKLCFRKMADFAPEEIVRQVAELAAGEPEGLGPHGAGRSTDCLVAEILHAPAFQRLEASWRALEYLETGPEPRRGVQTHLMALFPLTKAELQQDLLARDGVEGSVLFQQIYGGVARSPYRKHYCGSYPSEDSLQNQYSILLGDYQFDHSADDVALLVRISQIAEAAHAPFIAGASPSLFGWQDFQRLLETPAQALDVFGEPAYQNWRELQQTPAARYLCLALPRLVLRQSPLLWGNAAYCVAAKVARSFQRHGWPVGNCGSEEEGIDRDLASAGFDERETESVEASMDDSQATLLSTSGLTCLVGDKHTGSPVFFSAPSLHRPMPGRAGDWSRVPIAVRAWSQIPAVLAMSRVVHYLRTMVRIPPPEWSMRYRVSEVEGYLNHWLVTYVEPGASFYHGICPMKQARVEVRLTDREPREIVGTVYLHPSFGFEKWSSAELPAPMTFRVELITPQWYERQAKAGDSMAMVCLANMYEEGIQDVAPDYGIARQWYEKAAAVGNSKAMFHLAIMYEKGRGAPQDYAMARQWYERAAAEGDPGAMYVLGRF